MKILIVSDTESNYIWDHFNPDAFKDIDLIISCGDLKSEYLQFLVTMINVPLLYVHGNHDAQYLANPPYGCDSIEDSIVTVNGIRFLGLGGSMRYNKGPFQFDEKEMQKRIRKLRLQLRLSKGFDVLVTHSPAFCLNDGEDLCHTGFKSFVRLLDRYSPKYMFHGHQHLNYARKKRTITYKKTTIINACEYHVVEY